MLRTLRIILSIIVIVVAGYSLVTRNFDMMPYVLLSLGVLTLLTGIIEIKRDRKGYWGYVNVAVSLFVFYVAIQGLLL